MISKLNHSWRRRFAAGAALAITAALTFMVAAARPDAGNPILGTIKASLVSQTSTTVTIAVKGEWNWLSHNADCNYNRAATGAGLAWGDRNGADNTRTITSIVRNNNVVTVTMPAMTWNVGDRVVVAGVSLGSFNGGPFTVTAVSGTTVKYTQTGGNVTSGAGKIEDIDIFNGWEVFKSAASNAWIGTQLLEKDGGGATLNPIDREVHPVDRGNIPADGHGPLPGALVSNGAPVDQARFDPGMNATTGLSNNFAQWKGGCGREPVDAAPTPITSATENASKVVTLTLGAPGNAGMNVGDSITVAGVANNNYNGNYTITGLVGANQITYTSGKAGLPASSGGTVADNTLGPNQAGQGCIEWCGDPWGSWGYDTFDAGSYTLGFTHTYLKQIPDPLHPGQTISGLPEKICVNFYDVHGGGTSAAQFQAVNGTKEVQVDGNGDNSIQTNAFNVSDGANCTALIGSSITTAAQTPVPVGSTIHDTATLNTVPGAGGTITFRLFGPSASPNCSGAPVFTSTTPASGPGSVSGPGSYQSGDFTTSQTGKYYWTADYSGDPSSFVLPSSSACGADGETSTVTPANPTLTTNAGAAVTLGMGNLTDTATLSGGFNPTGSISFKLYGPNDPGDCSSAPVFTSTPSSVNGNGSYQSASYTPTAAGTYRWIANYSGDSNNNPTSNGCNGTNENVIVNKHDSSIVTHQSFIPQDNAAVTGDGVVIPTGNVAFELHQGTCAGPVVFSQTKALDATGHAKTTNAGNPSPGYTASGNGTWFWKVSYLGDANNQPSVSNCVETFTITEP